MADEDHLRVRHHATLWYWDLCPSEGLAAAWPTGSVHAVEPVGIARGSQVEALVVRVAGRTHQYGRVDRQLHITLAFDAANNGKPADAVDLLRLEPALVPCPAVALSGTVTARWAETAD